MSGTRYLVFLNLCVGRNQSWIPCPHECALGEKASVFFLSWSQQRLLRPWTAAFFATVLSAFIRKVTRRACQWVGVVNQPPRVQNCRFGKVAAACMVSTDSAKNAVWILKTKQGIHIETSAAIPDPFHFHECMWRSNQEEMNEWMMNEWRNECALTFVGELWWQRTIRNYTGTQILDWLADLKHTPM